MRNFLFVLVTFLVIFTFCLYTISMDFLSSIIPGWHTTTLPPYFFISFIIVVNFIFPLFMFWIISKRDKKLRISFFIIHIILSTLIISVLKFPTIFINSNAYDINQSEIESIITLIKTTLITFIIEQLIFGIYLILILKKQNENKTK
jgi:hypothetical protein